MSFVYVLNATGTSYYKINSCKNMIRVNELKTKHGFAIDIIFIIECDDYQEIEKILHDVAFANNREPLQVKIDGYTEWFNLSDEQIKALTFIGIYEELVNFTREHFKCQTVDNPSTLKRQTYYITELQINAINEMSFHEKMEKSKIVRDALEKYLPQKYLKAR